MAYGLAQKVAAKALIENGHSRREVARQLNVSPNSVSEWVKDNRVEILPQKVTDQIKSSLVGHAYKNAYRLQDSITEEKIAKATLQQTAVSFAVFIDKARLMENLSTQNVSYNGVLQNIENDRARLMERFAALENGSA